MNSAKWTNHASKVAGEVAEFIFLKAKE